ncbi:helicase C-terminal domain-containing protein [Halorubrum coriense]|uniref:helicase C-terminal domain-containing protein n=1 Tax=Halorubrum coriense TaxID=64713 RepID=UPI0009B5B216|nr:helicase C-terminal domain-containing protein [Halorubrum coriense]
MPSDIASRATSLFPYPSYRDYQRKSLIEAAEALYEQGYQNVVLNLPTGIGKSAINVTVAELADSAFITTPQKALRRQLEEDNDLREYYSTLRARDDYTCVTGSQLVADSVSCKECEINKSDDRSCIDQQNCEYWESKQDAIDDKTAVLTFSYLILDRFLPEYIPRMVSGEEVTERVSFSDRELLVVDECHKLESQVASLHAGITVSPYSLPEGVVDGTPSRVDIPDDGVLTFEDVEDELQNVYDRAQDFIEDQAGAVAVDNPDLQDCMSFCEKYEWCVEQTEGGRDWVVEKSETAAGESLKIVPVDVDEFLQENVWSRSEKRLLSTATMPFSSSPEKWLDRLGLNPSLTKVIQYPMPFPSENRQIITKTEIGRMSSGGFEEHFDAIVEKIRLISRKHSGEKGLVHTVSYDRAEKLHEHFEHNARCHSRTGDDLNLQISHWQQSDDDIFFSPSAMDGVDLPGEKCRWQALVKVPYPNLADPRTRFLTSERGRDDIYMERTSQQIQQSVGRGVRKEGDKCRYYVLDESFSDVKREADFPSWFEEAIV